MPSPLAQVAYSGFHDAGAYDAHRPSYPAAAVSCLLGHLGLLTPPPDGSGPTTVVEIGAGTGKFTELLSRHAAQQAAAASGSGPPLQIVAVEPHAQMRAQLEAKSLLHVTAVDGHGADLRMIGDGAASAVIAAQAFHWWDASLFYSHWTNPNYQVCSR